MNFAQILDKLMIKNNISKYKMAKDLEISPSTITNWIEEKSLPNIEIFKKIVQYFGVTADYLLTGTKDGAQIVAKLSCEEEKLLKAYRKANESEKRILDGILDGILCNEINQEEKKSPKSSA